MKYATKLLLGLCALVLFGCGGNGNGQAFVGSYVGTWTDAQTSASGVLNLVVDGNAHVSGTMQSTANGTGTIDGTIFATGWINSNITFPDTTVMHFTGSVAYKDPSDPSGSGLQGTMSGTISGSTSTINIDVDRP